MPSVIGCDQVDSFYGRLEMHGPRDSMSQICLLGLALAGGLAAQEVKIGEPLVGDDAIRWLRPVEETGREEIRLLTLMPTRRWQYIRALRALGSLQTKFGDRVVIAGLLPEKARDLVKLRLRGPSPLIGMAIDIGDRLRATLDHDEDGFDLAQAILLNRMGRVLWIGELDPGMGFLIADLLAARVGESGLCRLMQIESSFNQISVAAAFQLEVGSGQAEELSPLYWQPWAARMRDLPRQDWNRDAVALLQGAIIALSDRPEFLARVLRRGLERAPVLGERPEVSESIQTVLAQIDSPSGDLLGFVWHAQQRQDGMARSHAIRYIDRFKGASKRLVAFHLRLGKQCYGDRFVQQQLAALDLAAPGGSADAKLLRTKFELLAGKLGAPAAAARVGRELIACRAGDVSFLNSFAWSLLTEQLYQGKMDALALHAVEVMGDQDGWDNYWRLDTLALALFVNGRVDEAIEVQERAVAKCEAGSVARYTQRLERYRGARIQAVPGK